MRATFNAILIASFLLCKCAQADRVSAKDGRIVLQTSSGQKSVLTQTGLDSEPWISSDGKTVVFIRHSANDMFRTSVYKLEIRTRTTKLLYSGPARYEGRESSYFANPKLNESQDTLFLVAKEYATSGALLCIHLESNQVKFISDEVVGYDVMPCPKEYKGDLLVLKRHEADILGRPFFLYYRYSQAGEDLGLVGGEELDQNAISDDNCEGPEPKHEPRQALSLRTNQPEARQIDANVMDRQLITRADPTYPNQALTDRIQGVVRLQVRIGADGTVQEAHLVSGPPQLVAAAIDAVKQWKYRPVITAGHPVAVTTTVDVPFRLPASDQ